MPEPVQPGGVARAVARNLPRERPGARQRCRHRLGRKRRGNHFLGGTVLLVVVGGAFSPGGGVQPAISPTQNMAKQQTSTILRAIDFPLVRK